MRAFSPVSIATVSLLIYSCSCNHCDNSVPVVSQQYVHKYGFDVSPNEWAQRASEGKIISTLENGVKATENLENGILHGMATYTFPFSDILERIKVYDQGILLKEIVQDRKGIPIKEEMYEFDNRKIVTLWDHNGAPLSVEEYDGETLVEGTYYNTVGDIESTVQEGTGVRMKKDRSGRLLSKDQMEKGLLVCRTTFHPNNQIEMVSHYDSYLLHGEQTVFTLSGKLCMKAGWDHGALQGLKTSYREGVPYLFPAPPRLVLGLMIPAKDPNLLESGKNCRALGQDDSSSEIMSPISSSKVISSSAADLKALKPSEKPSLLASSSR